MKMLYILNIANRVNSFSHASMCAASKMGIDFHIAGNWGYASEAERASDEQKYGIHIHQIDFLRAPYDFRNRKAMDQLQGLVKKEKFDIIHCNTPIGGVLGRLVGKKCGVKKIIYQAHGFHFYKGAPLLNWFLYYPIERWLARYTDAIITINQEDYAFAQKKMRLRNNGKIYYVPGVGIDTTQYQLDDSIRNHKRLELGLTDEDMVLISMGDLIARKNYEVSIHAIARANNPQLHYLICGEGPRRKSLKELAAKLGVSEQVHFLGFRPDIKELLMAADIFFFTTLQEGLPRSMMEAMVSGLPCVASKIRGNVDLVVESKGGYLCEPSDVNGFAEAISNLAYAPEKRKQMAEFNLNHIKNFDVSIVTQVLSDIYSEVFMEIEE